MHAVRALYTLGYAVFALLFAASGLILGALAIAELWRGVTMPDTATIVRATIVIEAIGLIAVGLMAIEMSQTVVEEETLRKVHVSAPTRVRRYVSRFLVVVVVAMAIESLVAIVHSLHDRPDTMPYAAAVTASVALLLAAWGVFVTLNRSAEELEPEGIEEAREEDQKVQAE